MKTIRINVPLTVICETQDTVIEPIQSFGTHRTDGRFYVRQTIDALCGAVRVTIVGDQGAVQSMLADAPSDPHSLIQRALSALGYVVGDHKKDIEQFSRWVDHLVAFPRSDEAKAAWTEAMLRLFGSDSPPLMPSTIAEASGACGAFIVERMRLFPPAPKTDLDDGPELPEKINEAHYIELQEWRSAAKANGIDSPKELAESTNMSFGQFVDRKISREWQAATGCKTPADARMKIGGCKESITEARSTERVVWQSAIDAWQEATGAMNPHAAYKRIQELEAKLLSYAGEIDALRKAEARRQQVHSPEERELAKVRAELQSKCREAQTERERADTAEGMYRAECVKRESEVRTEKKRADSLAEELRECDKIISKAREFARLAQHDTKSIVDWCREARAKLATAIVPLPKPERVEAGQKWAFVMTAKSGEEIGNEYLAGRFNDASCRHFAAFHQDIATGFYLGT